MRVVLALAAAALVVSCTFPDVTFGDAAAPSDSGADVATGDADGSACDEDHDGYLSTACGGNDCDDYDPRVHPDAGFLTDVPDGSTNGDWNCDGKIELEWPFVSCGLTSCNAQSFVIDAGCGTSAQFVSCTTAVTCAAVPVDTRTQGCR